jgi:hypothetical protein
MLNPQIGIKITRLNPIVRLQLGSVIEFFSTKLPDKTALNRSLSHRNWCG